MRRRVVRGVLPKAHGHRLTVRVDRVRQRSDRRHRDNEFDLSFRERHPRYVSDCHRDLENHGRQRQLPDYSFWLNFT
jgi:hypothetical protein